MVTDKNFRTYLIGFIVVVIAIIGGYLLWTSASYRSVTVYDTPYTTGMFPRVDDESIYAYNGISFYRTPLSGTGKVEVLYDKAVLPQISSLSWVGDRGVLFSTDAVTLSDTSLAGSIPDQNDPTNQTWYLDFKTGTIRAIAPGALSSVRAVFSVATNRVFFLTALQEEERTVNNLLSYTPGAPAATVAVRDIGFENATDLGICNNASVCVLQTDGKNMELWTPKDGRKSRVRSFEGYVAVAPTGTPGLYVGSRANTGQDNNSADGSLLESTPELINVTNGEVLKLNMTIGSGSGVIASRFDSAKPQYYVVDTAYRDSNPTSSYGTTGTTVFGNVRTIKKPLTTPDDGPAEYAVGSISYGKNGAALYSSTEGRTYLIADQQQSYRPGDISADTLVAKLKPCLDGRTTSYLYDDTNRTLRINLNYDAGYLANITAFAGCVSRTTPEALIGFEYTFVGVDPTSGRYVTN